VGLTRQIREVLGQGERTKRQIDERLGICGRRGAARIWSRLRDLQRRGEVQHRPGPEGWIYWAIPTATPENSPVQNRIGRAVQLLSGKYRNFHWRQVVVLSEADQDYLQRCLRFWEGAGVLLRVGKRGNLLIYSLGPGWQGKRFPHFNRRVFEAEAKDKTGAEKSGIPKSSNEGIAAP